MKRVTGISLDLKQFLHKKHVKKLKLRIAYAGGPKLTKTWYWYWYDLIFLWIRNPKEKILQIREQNKIQKCSLVLLCYFFMMWF